MTRDYQINGETLVMVMGNGDLAVPGTTTAALWELGLAEGPIVVRPHFSHKDIHVDDFGPDIPAEVMWQLSDVFIKMTLIHYDEAVLQGCMFESMAGGSILGRPGTLAPAGTMMGNYKQPLSPGCHYISLNLLSPVLGEPWRFPTAYLADPPMEYPLGTKTSAVVLNWRAIPYYAPSPPTGEITSNKVPGIPLFLRTPNTGPQPKQFLFDIPSVPPLHVQVK